MRAQGFAKTRDWLAKIIFANYVPVARRLFVFYNLSTEATTVDAEGLLSTGLC